MFANHNFKKVVVSTVIVILLISFFTISAFARVGGGNELISSMNPRSQAQLSEEVIQVLNQYSDYLVTGKATNPIIYSNDIKSLIEERKAFYKEYSETGLNIQFVSMKSVFTISANASDTIVNNIHKVRVTEVVTLIGKSKVSSAEDYPLVKAGQWALGHTSNENISKYLQAYTENMIDGVNQTIKDGIEVNLYLDHELNILVSKAQIRLLNDSYSDKSEYNPEGSDNIEWANGKHQRIKPDLSQMPNYVYFHTPIEKLGQQLLNDYSVLVAQPLAIQTLNHSATASYSRQWVKATTITCSTNPIVYQDYHNYNLTPYPTYYSCNDCANFVSQALKAGGYTVDGTWYYTSNTWTYVPYLENYLVTQKGAVFASSLSSLQPGDIAFVQQAPTGNLTHVVVYSLPNPPRFSAHASDRLNEPFSSHTDINKFMLLP